MVVPDAVPERVAEQYAASMAGIIYQWLANPDIQLDAMFSQLKDDLRVRLATDRAKAERPRGRSAATRRSNSRARHSTDTPRG